VRIHVAFTPDEAAAAPTGIVIDVLRATSTIAQALDAGYERVLCVPEIEQARALRTELPDSLVGGERDAIRIDGFDVGASPREFLEPRAATLILSTTNGTRLLVEAASRYEHVYVGSLLNLDAVAAAARRHDAEVSVLCAGVLGELALDDAYTAGRIADAIGGDNSDSATAAIRLARSYAGAAEALNGSRSGWNLRNHDLQADIEWCARENSLGVAPRFARAVGAAAEVLA
jgi:2-phosphosulfolactate phosphatase